MSVERSATYETDLYYHLLKVQGQSRKKGEKECGDQSLERISIVSSGHDRAAVLMNT